LTARPDWFGLTAEQSLLRTQPVRAADGRSFPRLGVPSAPGLKRPWHPPPSLGHQKMFSARFGPRPRTMPQASPEGPQVRYRELSALDPRQSLHPGTRPRVEFDPRRRDLMSFASRSRRYLLSRRHQVET